MAGTGEGARNGLIAHHVGHDAFHEAFFVPAFLVHHVAGEHRAGRSQPPWLPLSDGEIASAEVELSLAERGGLPRPESGAGSVPQQAVDHAPSYIRLRRSRSAASTRSSMEWMVALTGPSSHHFGPGRRDEAAVRGASGGGELRAVAGYRFTASPTASINRPGSVRKGSPECRQSIR